MAEARYDKRRDLVLEEANAISSTANFALMLPQEGGHHKPGAMLGVVI